MFVSYLKFTDSYHYTKGNNFDGCARVLLHEAGFLIHLPKGNNTITFNRITIIDTGKILTERNLTGLKRKRKEPEEGDDKILKKQKLDDDDDLLKLDK